MEKTLLIIKPDAIQRRSVGEIVGRFENKGFQIIAMKMACLAEEIVRLEGELKVRFDVVSPQAQPDRPCKWPARAFDAFLPRFREELRARGSAAASSRAPSAGWASPTSFIPI